LQLASGDVRIGVPAGGTGIAYFYCLIFRLLD
jgi:hypothetical protein